MSFSFAWMTVSRVIAGKRRVMTFAAQASKEISQLTHPFILGNEKIANLRTPQLFLVFSFLLVFVFAGWFLWVQYTLRCNHRRVCNRRLINCKLQTHMRQLENRLATYRHISEISNILRQKLYTKSLFFSLEWIMVHAVCLIYRLQSVVILPHTQRFIR